MRDKKFTLLILDDDEFSLENLKLSLNNKGYKLYFCATAKKALSYIENEIDIIISDLKLPGTNGVEVIKEFKDRLPCIKSILITGYSDEPLVIKAIKTGINDIIKKPYEEIELFNSIQKQINQITLERESHSLKEKVERENQVLKTQLNKKILEDEYLIVGESKAIKDVLAKAITISNHGLNTLVHGESGTGKELLARYIHRNGPRKNYPFIPINCSEINSTLFESELFGYVKGAFTDAANSRAGLIEIANGGILYLDEITEMDISLQSKLLRVVEEKKVRRIGSNEWMDINIQIISSTNRNIEEVIENNILRNDLFHRLSETQIYLPPLRERIDDFKLLTTHFISKYELLLNIKSPALGNEKMKLLTDSEWPGNLRQFSNFIKTFCLFGNDWSDEDFILHSKNHYQTNQQKDTYKFSLGNMKELENAKTWLIDRALKKFNGNKSKAAEHLGITYQGLLKMLKKQSDD
ncbi:MAG: sigma-54 dependent transcriptional regulator [Melioribacteraceae bacterium]|nr:MAG: sigma-54 dependent transcriptional regulator [Melioribacteraceae bacterium]